MSDCQGTVERFVTPNKSCLDNTDWCLSTYTQRLGEGYLSVFLVDPCTVNVQKLVSIVRRRVILGRESLRHPNTTKDVLPPPFVYVKSFCLHRKKKQTVSVSNYHRHKVKVKSYSVLSLYRPSFNEGVPTLFLNNINQRETPCRDTLIFFFFLDRWQDHQLFFMTGIEKDSS